MELVSITQRTNLQFSIQASKAHEEYRNLIREAWKHGFNFVCFDRSTEKK